MDLKNIIIKNNAYGKGTILENNDKYIKVKFQDVDVKTFKYPDAYNKFIYAIDTEEHKRILAEIELENNKKIHERKLEKSRIEQEKKKQVLEEKKREIKNNKERQKEKTTFIKLLREKYQFEGFHHYTDFTNFINIMELGKLFSREEASSLNFLDAAEKNIIDYTRFEVKKCVRFYYKERTPTLYNNEGIKIDNIKPHMPIPVLLLFDEDIIYFENTKFTSGCGGSNKSIITKDLSMVKSSMFNWEKIFSRGPILEEDEEKGEIINNRNAEFLVQKEADINFIKKIIFRCPADKKHAISILGNSDKYVVEQEKFFNEESYLYDYKLCCNNTHYYVYLKFNLNEHKFIECYEHKLRYTYRKENEKAAKILTTYIKKEPDVICFEILREIDMHLCKIEYKMNGHLSAIWEKNYD